MSDDESPAVEKTFFVDRAKTGRAGCKKCKQKIDSGELRLAKLGTNPFGAGTIKMWHHVTCLFEVFKKQRASTARINTPSDIDGWDSLTNEDQTEIIAFLPDCVASTPLKDKKNGRTSDKLTGKLSKQDIQQDGGNKQKGNMYGSVPVTYVDHKDNSFREFRRLCADIANEPSYTGKTALVNKLFTHGSDSTGFKGDLVLWCHLLLPATNKRIYNLQSKQLVKLFSRIFHTNQDEMLVSLEQGDVAETIRIFFESSLHLKPIQKSTLTLIEVDEFLSNLADITKEDDQVQLFKSIATKCTSNDLKMIIRLVKHDLRINAGPKHILEAVHHDAYEAFQASHDIRAVLARVSNQAEDEIAASGSTKTMQIKVALMTPVQPMLAEPCKSIDYALKKCPHGMYSEIKYDGERVQVHKRGTEFKYYSRSLKAVLPHKVVHFKDFIPKAFPHGNDLILDAEILLIDNMTGQILPFGTLGIHKKTQFEHANVCLFVFDCIYFNGKTLLDRSMQDRRKILEKNMTEIKNHIMFSEMKILHSSIELKEMITEVFKLGLEGLVIKDAKSTYEPGKRHWLKVKKDYLFGGAMADSVDLVVLGAWFGTGAKGGMMSSFLMGVLDTTNNKWCTVTKVHGGHDDATLKALQSELDMVKISKDVSRVPNWLTATKTMIPDFVASDPCRMPVWEITGAEFTQHKVHSAHGISIRFPRITKIRHDKDWKTATSLQELDELYKRSKESADFVLPESSSSSQVANVSSTPKKTPVKAQMKQTIKPPFIDSPNETSKKKRVNKKLNVDSTPSTSTEVEDDCLPAKRRKQKISPQKPLPDLFCNIKLCVPRLAKDCALLERYFVAYGGILLPTSLVHQSTHVLHTSEEKGEDVNCREANHVDIRWLWDSIKLQSIQRTELYAVQGAS